jgi:hypothetical protein
MGLGESKVSACPPFSISREPYGFLVTVTGLPVAKFRRVDLADRKSRFELVKAIAEAFPDLAHGDGLMAMLQAVKELAAGQACAGSVVDELRAVISVVAGEMANAAPAPHVPPAKPERHPTKAEKIRRMNLELSGVGR